MLHALPLVVVSLFGVSPVAEWDSRWSGSSVAFGSCNRVFPKGGGPIVKQPLWDKMLEKNVEGFYWVGDAVYPVQHHNNTSLKEAFEGQVNHPQYKKFLSSVSHIDGTWDDHDRGANDEGIISDNNILQDMFLDFLKLPDSSSRRERNGVYSAHKVSNPKNPSQSIGVILLDTRTHRDAFPLEVLQPFVRLHPLIAASSRLFAALIGYNDGGDVLGEDQWRWFENILKEPLDGFIIVSSIQVNTSIPLVESWGHFSTSQQRLLSLLNGTNTVTFLSGDVHFAEMGYNEFTTSGMTHTCATQFTPLICDSILRSFGNHRVSGNDFFTGFNYLHLTVNWEDSTMKFSILDDSNNPQLTKTLPLRSPTVLLPATPFSCFNSFVIVFWGLIICIVFILFSLIQCCSPPSKVKVA